MKRWALLLAARGKPAVTARVVAAIAARGVTVAGFVQEPIMEDGERVGHRLVRIGRGEELVVARPGAAARGPHEETFCSFVFDNDAFGAARRWIEEDAAGAGVLLIDEVSKLEIAGKGHHDAVAWALGADRLVVLAVRADQLFGVMERFALDEPVASFDAAEQDGIEVFADAVAVAAS